MVKLEDLDAKFIKVKESNIRYTVKGSGAPILLFHGIGEFLEAWWRNIDPLSEHYLVYAMDLPGHGLSDKSAGSYSLSFVAELVSDFMKAMGIERAHLIGHSLGGILALSMAVNYPDRVGKLILVDCGGLDREVPLLYRLCTLPVLGDILVRPTVKAGLRNGIKRRFYNPQLVTEEMVDKDYEFMKMPETKRAMLDIIRSNVNLSGLRPEIVMTDKLRLVKSPTLFIHGEQDAVIPLAHARHACNLIPDARLEAITECGHCPYIEKASEFNEMVIAFLGSNGRVENVG